MCTDIWIKKVLQASFRAKTLLHGKTKQNKTKTKKKKENERRKEKENKKKNTAQHLEFTKSEAHN